MSFLFFFNDTATTEIYTLSLHDALPIWSPVEYAGHDAVHVDPIALESKVVVDATGHDAAIVALLNKRGLYKAVPGNGAMWVERSEELVVENTREVYPNCFLAGLSVSAVGGSPRSGPAFGAML